MLPHPLMNRGISVFIVLGATILLSGCLKITIEETVFTNLTIRRSTLVDFSPSLDIMDSLSEIEPEPMEGATEAMVTQESCDEAMQSTQNDEDIQWRTVQCTVIDDHTMKIEGIIDTKHSKGITLTKTQTSEGTIYRYVQNSDENQMSSLEEDDQMLENMFLFTITMPGKVRFASAGTIKGSTVTIDSDSPNFQEFVSSEELVVESIVSKRRSSRTTIQQKKTLEPASVPCGPRRFCTQSRPRLRKEN